MVDPYEKPIPFRKRKRKQDEPLVLILESPAHEGDTVALRTSKEDVYPDGDLHRRGITYPRDLAFAAQGTSPDLQQVYDGEVQIYENKTALPRAFVVPRAETLPPAEILARMSDPAFDPRAAVLIEQPALPGFEATAPAGGPAQASAA